MATRREWLYRFLPRGLPWMESVNNSARFIRQTRARFADCPEFASRELLYRHLASGRADTPIDYFEFGVWKGDSMRAWTQLNSAPASRFVGFDTFEGLPEDWVRGVPKGTFSTGGTPPALDDPRVTFVPGLFQATLRDYLERHRPTQPLVVHVDCDLYSSTLFVLGTLDRFFKPGTIVVFDDFYSLDHEYRAFFDYERSFQRPWRALGKTHHCTRVALEFLP